MKRNLNKVLLVSYQITVFFAFLSLLFPVILVVFSFVTSACQALSLYMFVHLLSSFAGGRMETVRQSLVRGKTKLYAVPPFGCCFAPCHKPVHFTPRKLVFARLGVLQACFVQPMCSFLTLFLKVSHLPSLVSSARSHGLQGESL